MRRMLRAAGGLVRLAGIVAERIGPGVAGDLAACWVREQSQPSDPIARHLLTCPRCAWAKATCPPAMGGCWRYACPELARLNEPVLIRGKAIATARSVPA